VGNNSTDARPPSPSPTSLTTPGKRKKNSRPFSPLAVAISFLAPRAGNRVAASHRSSSSLGNQSGVRKSALPFFIDCHTFPIPFGLNAVEVIYPRVVISLQVLSTLIRIFFLSQVRLTRPTSPVRPPKRFSLPHHHYPLVSVNGNSVAARPVISNDACSAE